MSRLLAIAAAMILPATAWAGLQWEQKEIRSEAKPGDTAATVSFKFTNKGTKTVTIYSMNSSCGCTAAALQKKIYAAGDSGEIAVTFKFSGRTGQQSESVTVRTDDSASDAELRLTVTIPKLISLTQAYLFWRLGEELKPKETVLKIEAPAPCGQLTATSSDPRIKVSAEAVTEGREYKITVTPDTAISGPMVHAIITLETALTTGQKLSANIYAFAKH